jgi:predicted nucleotidyltransferase
MNKIELFLGRLQPIHTGHKKIIDSMKNPVVVIVKGGKSSEDKIRNPLSVEYQEKLLKKVSPGVEVSISPNGFLPGILGYFRKQGKEVTTIYAGADRIEGYQSAIEKANEKMPDDQKYHVTFKETERYTSATAVRNAIRSNDYDTFKKLVPKEIWDEWDTLRKTLAVNEDVTATTLSANVETKDQPLLKKPLKRFRKLLPRGE